MSRRHTRNLKPAAASEKNPANFGDLSTFTFKRVLSKNFLKKEIVVEGYFTDREGRAILVLEKTPFTEEAAAQSICTSESILENQFFKDHGLHTWYPEPRLGGLKTTIIFPATDEDFKNYELQPMHLIEETPKQYNEITLPHVTSESSNIQSVHGILTHQAEQDRIVFEDADPDVGFFLLPDSKWDQKEITNLHLLAISHRQNIKTLRDLTAEHLPLLKNIRDKGTRAINKKFKVGKSRLIIYLDYQPSYHQLHIHFTYLQPDTQDIQIGKSHLLNTVIDNIELVPDYYQRCTLPFFVKESDKLFSLFKQEQKAAIDEEDDLERTGYETDNSEQSTKSIFESTTLNNSDSIIYGSEDEKTKNKSIFLHKTMHLGDGSKIVKTAEMNNHDDSNNETDDGVRRSRRSNNSASAKEGKISIDKDDSGAHKKKRENKRSKNKSNSFNDDVNDDDETDKIIKIEKDKIIAKIENESNDGVSDNDDTINETGVVEIKTENNSEIEDSVPASNDDDTAAAAEADEDSDDIFTIKTSFIKKKDESQLEEESEAEEQEKAKNNKKKRKGEVLEENVKHEKKKNKDKKVKEVPEEIKNQEKKKSTDKKRKGEISEEDEKNEKKKNKDKKVKEEEDDDEEGDKNKEDDVSEENDEQEKTKKKEKKRKGEIPEEDEKHEKKKSKDKKRKDEISEDEKHEKKKNKDKKVKEEAEEDDDDDDDGDDVSEENEEQEKTKNKEKKRKGEIPEEHEKKKNKDKKIKEEDDDDDDDDEDKNKEDDASEENEEQEKKDESPSKRKRVEIQYENGASKESSESEVEIIKKKKRGPTKKKKIVLSDSDEEYKVISDSEDGKSSESDSKGTKRKKATSSSVGSSDEGSKKKTKKKRKRIIHRGDSSSDNEEKADLDSSQNKGRRNIKKIIKDVDVAETTRSAAKDEEERKQRILDRQKAYNEMFKLIEENAGKKIEKLVLDFDPKTKEELISVDKGLVAKMKPHQANGVKFMWDACFESLERIKDGEGCGCILAHCMGLGKTFQVISLVHTVLSHQDLTKVRTVLVVCPFSTVLNWYGEFEKWMEDVEENDDLNVCHISNEKVNYKRAYRLKDWHEDGGVMIIGYDMYRNLTNENSKAIKKKVREVFQRTLVDPGPDLIVCDEGHMLKNEATALSKAMNKIRTLRRIVLTGTPLQNNLSEYHCMVNFVKPNLLGTKKEFTNRFVNPITNGQFADSTERDFKIMKRRAHVLHKMLDGLVQRRDYNVLTPYLPPKQEYVLSIRLTDLQVQLYREFLETKVNITKGFRVTLFADFQQLSRIWTHPLALKYSLERQMKKEAMNDSGSDSAGSLKDFVIDSDEDSTPASSSSESEGSTKNTKSKTTNNSGRMTRANAKNGVAELETMKDDPDVAPVTVQETSSWWNGIVKPEHFEDICVSSKLVLLFDFLKECEQIGEKVLVFSQSLYSLDVIEHFLDRIDEATQNGCEDSFLMGHTSSWTKGLDYFRLDGSTSGENRSAWIQSFNRESNTRARLFLISTRAGGLGINLTAANRVIIFDASWNPSHDIQSIFRVYRFGQRKPCYIYRFIAQGTMEEKVYERQIAKLSLSQRVVDEQQVNRYFSQNDLQELYNFTPADPKDAPIPTVPKDRLMADMLHAHKQWIFKIFEHDSLLDHVEEEELDEEERKAAWEDYENEKKRGFAINSAPNNVQMGNPFMQAGMPTYENVRQMVLAQNPLIPKDDLHKLVTSMLYKLYMNQQQKDLLFRQQLLQQQYAAQSVGGQQQQPYQVMRNPFSLPITQQARNTDNAMVQQASTGTAAMPQNFNQPSTSSNLNAQQNTSDTDMKK